MPLHIVSHDNVFILEGTQGVGGDVFVSNDGDEDHDGDTTDAKVVSALIFARMHGCSIEEVEHMKRAYLSGNAL